MAQNKHYELRHYEAIMLLHDVIVGTNDGTDYYLQPGSSRDSDCLMLTLGGTFSNPLSGIVPPLPVRFHFATIRGQLRLRLENTDRLITVKAGQSYSLMSHELAHFYPVPGHIHWYGLWYWDML